ncbi:MAG: lipid A deacylase LpxR family protein [Candidatus Thiodiazotropha sp.]
MLFPNSFLLLLLCVLFFLSNPLFSDDQNNQIDVESLLTGELTISEECKSYINSLSSQVGDKISDKELFNAISASHLRRSLTIENDTLAGQDDDRHYTNGVKLTWIHSPCRVQNEWTRGIAKKIFKFTSIFNDALYRSTDSMESNSQSMFVGGVFGMNMYTPNDLSIRDRIIEDRPYAGWLYGGFSVQSISYPTKSSDAIAFNLKSLELQIGVVGPMAAQERFQTWIHDDVGSSTIPRGWDNQIDNRPGVSLLFEDKMVFPKPLSERLKNFIAHSPHWGFNVGNISNYINAGYTFSLSRDMFYFPSSTIAPSSSILSQSSASFNDLFISNEAQNENGENINPFYNMSDGYAYSFFVGFDGRLYASNIFIEGEGDSEHDIDLEPFVYDLYAGAAYSNTWFDTKFTISYKFIRRSEEFSTTISSYNKPHNIGHLNFEWAF